MAVLLRRDVSKDTELLVLRHENAVLRRQIPRVRYEPADRFWFAALSSLISRRRWAEVFSVSPATVLAWHRSAGCPQVGLQRPTETRQAADGCRGEEARADDGEGQSDVGPSPDPR